MGNLRASSVNSPPFQSGYRPSFRYAKSREKSNAGSFPETRAPRPETQRRSRSRSCAKNGETSEKYATKIRKLP